jgi:16S rRNA (adenine1518-N6/adenine1519-N6)-dimethyltransferase
LPSSSHRPRKRFGQHFLHERGVLARIADAICPSQDDYFLEIGPGEGALTRQLVGRCARLDVIEIDRDLAASLREEFQDRISVHEADALAFDYACLPRGCRVVGNLPYNISTPLLFELARHAQGLRDLHFMLQLEVVERMVAAPRSASYGRLSVALQARFRMRKLFNVASGAFRPPPRIESAFVRLEPREKPLEIDEELLRRAFSARRKTLRNALPGFDFEALGLDPRARPETLSPEDYARLSMNSIL